MFYRWKDGNLILNCYIKSGASKSRVIGLYDDRLKIAILEPARNGKANKGLIHFLSVLFKVIRRDVVICSGMMCRQKVVCIVLPEKLPEFLNIQSEQDYLQGCEA